jgi:general secretion pathway protein A
MKSKNHYRSLWGATDFAFADKAEATYEHETFIQIRTRLQHWIAQHCSGVLDGENGVGKTYLINTLIEQLDPKQYYSIQLSHSTLQGAGLIRQICRRLGLEPRMQRGDNLELIHQRCDELRSNNTWPLIIADESQNLNAQSMEELRLINCHKSSSQPGFSMLFVGDKHLLGKLKMGVNHALLSRLSFYHELTALNAQQVHQYIQKRLHEVMIHSNPFHSDVIETIARISAGKPRLINLLCRASMQAASEQNTTQITPIIVQQSIESLPWIHQLPG